MGGGREEEDEPGWACVDEALKTELGFVGP
jgi:hypothetical protein